MFRHSLSNICLAATVLGCTAGLDHHARADAIVTTEAMRASTIAEISIKHNEIRVELEVGQADLLAFKNILPDAMFTKLTGKHIPADRRWQTFLEQDWNILAGGRQLKGSIESFSVGQRIVRDNVTGEPLQQQPTDAPHVLKVALRYPFHGKPKSITFRSPRDTDGNAAANIGFICYHNGLPVNDFRYMPAEIALALDWTDPWYSQFEHPNFRRQFNAPLSAYLYIEPHEVRKEIIIRPKDLEAWVELGIGNSAVIPVAAQAELKQRVADFLLKKNPLTVDGHEVQGRLDRIHFIRRTLRSTGIVEPPVDLDATSATLGVIFVYPIDQLPSTVEMTWELFSPKIQTVPAVATDEAGGLPARVTRADPVLTWKNYLTNPTIPAMETITTPIPQSTWSIPIASAVCGLLAIIALGVMLIQRFKKHSIHRSSLAITAIAVIGAVVLLPYTKVAVANPLAPKSALPDAEARKLIASLLQNIYRSFDHHDESLIYDRLAQSIAGDLLSTVYLDTRRSIEVKNQGGLRVSVKQVDILELEPLDASNPTNDSYRCRWRVAGLIGHWGHIHRRMNQHTANITVSPSDGQWKITAIEMLDEQPAELPDPAETTK